MIGQTADRREHKNRGKNAAGQPSTGLEKRGQTTDVLIDDEIDPADFFDPEEFGIRRRDQQSRP
jgi:hypothetical protein